MSNENQCDLGKWKLFVKVFEKNPVLAYMVVGTACASVFLFMLYAGQGVREGVKIFTQKSITRLAHD